MRKINNNLKQLMLDKQETLKTLSRKTGISECAIKHIRNGIRNGSIDSYEKICLALNITLSELFYKDKEPIDLLNQPIEELQAEIRLLKARISRYENSN